MKRLKINKKEAGVGPFKKKFDNERVLQWLAEQIDGLRDPLKGTYSWSYLGVDPSDRKMDRSKQ